MRPSKHKALQKEALMRNNKKLLPQLKPSGKPYRSLSAVWSQLVAQNREEVREKKSEAMKERWGDEVFRAMQIKVMATEEVRLAISEGVKAANNDPEVIKRRMLTLEGRKRSGPSSGPHSYGEGFENARPPSLDDRGGHVYVIYQEGSSEGPYKIGSSFSSEDRIKSLEESGYYDFFPSGCKLRSKKVYYADFFRRVELRAHEILGMNKPYKKKWREMCFLPFPLIDKAIELAKIDVSEGLWNLQMDELKQNVLNADFETRFCRLFLQYEEGAAMPTLFIVNEENPEDVVHEGIHDGFLFSSWEEFSRKRFAVDMACAFAYNACRHAFEADLSNAENFSSSEVQNLWQRMYHSLRDLFFANREWMINAFDKPGIKEAVENLRRIHKANARMLKSLRKKGMLTLPSSRQPEWADLTKPLGTKKLIRLAEGFLQAPISELLGLYTTKNGDLKLPGRTLSAMTQAEAQRLIEVNANPT